jgi:hypothetical protein
MTTDVSVQELKRAVEQMHYCSATRLESVPVLETFQGKTVWDGVVQVFAITGHEQASRCYAWSSPVEGSENQRVFAVLHQPPIESPLDAVRAAIIQEYYEQQRRP